MVFSQFPGQMESRFLTTNLPLFLERFSLSYEQEDCSCIEYFLFSKEKMKQISKTLIVSHDSFSGSLYVARFYPEIYREINCKYLSATCFYLMAHHAAKAFHLADHCSVSLETDMLVFKTFYSRLNDFNFQINYKRPSERVCLKGCYHEFAFSTDEICHCAPPGDNEDRD